MDAVVLARPSRALAVALVLLLAIVGIVLGGDVHREHRELDRERYGPNPMCRQLPEQILVWELRETYRALEAIDVAIERAIKKLTRAIDDAAARRVRASQCPIPREALGPMLSPRARRLANARRLGVSAAGAAR